MIPCRAFLFRTPHQKAREEWLIHGSLVGENPGQGISRPTNGMISGIVPLVPYRIGLVFVGLGDGEVLWGS